MGIQLAHYLQLYTCVFDLFPPGKTDTAQCWALSLIFLIGEEFLKVNTMRKVKYVPISPSRTKLQQATKRSWEEQVSIVSYFKIKTDGKMGLTILTGTFLMKRHHENV